MRDYPTPNERGTGFLWGGRPCFDRAFLVAMSFHAPEGLAAVRDESGAYHLALDGRPAYERRFVETFGFYEGLATVRDERGWLHIGADGSPLHERRFRWAGNFQGGRCAVQDHHGFFHIDVKGADAYPARYGYAGDFRDGLAVVHGPLGTFHVRSDGRPLTSAMYVHAEPFHKGYAVVADKDGFFHVDKEGHALHAHRFRSAEPFYNGMALCRAREGHLVRLRVNGTWNRVAGDVTPIGLSAIREHLARGARVGLLVRHAERDPITPDTPNWGNDVLLTERGIADAELLGRALATAATVQLWSSPVARCRQTCQAIAAGAGSDGIAVFTHTHLGHPGIHFDGTGEHSELLRRDFHAFVEAYVNEGVAPGMRPAHEASEELLAFLTQHTSKADCTVFVTHDLFSAVLLNHLGLKAPDRDDWCDTLEGVCLIQDGDGTSFRRFEGVREVRRC